LHRANEKFNGRFDKVQRFAAMQGQTLESMSMEEKEILWQQAKQAAIKNER
jgi:uncharacterized protein YabN with tetrapyrrole methylase and pyrophosphatase domain